MEKLEFRSEEEKKIYRQLLGTKEAVKIAFEQGDQKIVQGEVEKIHRMLYSLEGAYSLAIYDLEEPSRIKRLCGRVFGKIFKLLFLGPFAKKQIAYNRQMLNTLHGILEMQEGILEVLTEGKKEQEDAE